VKISVHTEAVPRNHEGTEAMPLEVLGPLGTLRYKIATFYLASVPKFPDLTYSQLRTAACICSDMQLVGSGRLLQLLAVAQVPNSCGMPLGDLLANAVLAEELRCL
jgi:hypothetical protein